LKWAEKRARKRRERLRSSRGRIARHLMLPEEYRVEGYLVVNVFLLVDGRREGRSRGES